MTIRNTCRHSKIFADALESPSVRDRYSCTPGGVTTVLFLCFFLPIHFVFHGRVLEQSYLIQGFNQYGRKNAKLWKLIDLARNIIAHSELDLAAHR